MISTRALFDVGKRPVAVDERAGLHPRCLGPAHGRRSAPPRADKSGESSVSLAGRASFVSKASARETSFDIDARGPSEQHQGPPATLLRLRAAQLRGNEVTLRVLHRGDGQPVVLQHGHPRTHTTWHWVAPQLAGSFFLVRPDLRGYGQSTPPPDTPEHAQSSKRARTSCPLVTAACG